MGLANGEHRVAIVGAGPRAAYALERVAAIARSHDLTPPQVDVIAPGTLVGPGEIYAAGQPAWLRLNVASRVVNAWHTDAEGDPSLGLDAWRESREDGAAVDQFPSRSTAGAYLAEFGADVRRRVPGSRIDGTVFAVRRDGSRFTVAWRDTRAVHHHGSYDAVLLAIGHAEHWQGELGRDWPTQYPLVRRPYPISHVVNSRHLANPADGSRVLVRGAALTAIDVSLAVAHQQAGLSVILASRSGKLMAPKTEPEVLATMPRLAAVVEAARDRVLVAGTTVPDELLRTAKSLLSRGDRLDERAWEDALLELTSPVGPPNPQEWLAHRLAIAQGQAAPDPTWALGEAWRQLYPALVARQSHTDKSHYPLEWPDYHRWSAHLERLAFGPPPVNAHALLQMMQRGSVEVVAHRETRRLAVERNPILTVDAVLAPPGARDIDDPLVAGLIADGLASIAPRGRGLLVAEDATCLARGQRVGGLAAVGRLTEDTVMGNDTLTRTLHPHLDRWAQQVLRVKEPALHG